MGNKSQADPLSCGLMGRADKPHYPGSGPLILNPLKSSLASKRYTDNSKSVVTSDNRSYRASKTRAQQIYSP